MAKNFLYMVDVEILSEIIDLAIKHGKKPGDSMEEEFKEVVAKYKDRVRLIGSTDKDVDLLTGDCREAGLRVLNPHEYDKRKSDDT